MKCGRKKKDRPEKCPIHDVVFRSYLNPVKRTLKTGERVAYYYLHVYCPECRKESARRNVTKRKNRKFKAVPAQEKEVDAYGFIFTDNLYHWQEGPNKRRYKQAWQGRKERRNLKEGQFARI